MRSVYLAILVLVAACLGGCEQPVAEGGQTNPHPVRRIASLSPNTTELISVFYTNEIEFVGRTSSCDFPEGVKNIPVIGDVKPNYEKLAAAKPDLVVLDKSLYSDADIEQMKRAAPRAKLMVMDVHTLDGYVDFCYRLASAGGNETDMSQYLDKVYAARARVSGAKPAKAPKVLVMLGGSGSVYAAGAESFLADLVKIAGGEAVGPPGQKFMPMTPEAVVTANPDAIVCSVPKNEVLNDPRFKTVAAVRNGKVYSIKPEVLTRIGIRVDSLLDDVGKIVTLASQGNP